MSTTGSAVRPEMSYNGATALVIREATGADAPALRRLAQRDSARVPGGRTLIAEVGGEPHAAISLEDGTIVADPFRPTADLVALLELRADYVHRAARRGGSLRVVARSSGLREAELRPAA